MAESFQRTTRRRADDPGVAARPLRDAPPLIPTTPADHPDPLPPPGPPPLAETQRPHRPPTPQPDTTQQRTDQSRAHPQVHDDDDGPDVAAVTETDVATSATMQPRAEFHPPPLPQHTPAMASGSVAEGDRTGATAGAQNTDHKAAQAEAASGRTPPLSPGSPQVGGPSAGSGETAPRLIGVGPSASGWEPAPWIDPKDPPPRARWPGALGSWLAGHCLWVLVWMGACYWHGVSGFVFDSPSQKNAKSTATRV